MSLMLATATTSAYELLPQHVLPPRHSDRPLSYAPKFEIPSTHEETRHTKEFPKRFGSQAESVEGGPPDRRLWRQERQSSFPYQIDSEDNDHRVYEWHLYAGTALEDVSEERNRKLLQSQRDAALSSSTLEQHGHASLWSRLFKTKIGRLLSDSIRRVHATRNEAQGTTEGVLQSKRSLFDSENEIVTSGNVSDNAGYDHDLYPYMNQTDLNITGDGGAGADLTGPSGGDGNAEEQEDGEPSSDPPVRFGPLRIRAILTDPLEEETGVSILNETERQTLLMDIVHPAMTAWRQALRVRRVEGNLTLDPTQLVRRRFCGPGPAVPVPDEHIFPGLPDTDFVIYLQVARQTLITPTVNNTVYNETLNDDSWENSTDPSQPGDANFGNWLVDNPSNSSDDITDETTAPADRRSTPASSDLCAGDYIAASAFCNTDQYDRPIAAILHLCIGDDFFVPELRHHNIRTVMHELGHSLGFNAISLAHFRRRDGTPMTPRLPNGAVPLQDVECTGPREAVQGSLSGETIVDPTDPNERHLRLGEGLNDNGRGNPDEEDGGVSPSSSPGSYYARIPLPSEDILQFRTVRGVRVAQVVTPSVLQVVRNHFGCQALQGAELESGESICLGDHWERRLFKMDLMNPIVDIDGSSTRISTTTLAYFADSSWYQVDLSKASVAASWGRGAGCPFVEEPCIGEDGQVPPGLDSLFCSEKKSGALTLDGCTHDLLKKASCLMDSYDDQLPAAYQYFNHTYGSNVGGPDPFIDYCPYFQGLYNGMCSDARNEASIKINSMERVGSRNSRCLSGQLSYGKTALCLRIACVVQDKSLRVQVDNAWFTCTQPGQEIRTRLGIRVICPDPVRTCPTFYCPRDCLGSPELICDYDQGECVCPQDNSLPFTDGSCPVLDGDGDGGGTIPIGPNGGLGGAFYSPPVLDDYDPTAPADNSPMSDIYFQDERSLHDAQVKMEEGERTWPWPVVMACAVFSGALLIVRVRRRDERDHRLPTTVLDFPGDDGGDAGVAHARSSTRRRAPSYKQKMIATVVIDLRMQDQMQHVWVQDHDTEVASMTDTEGDHSNAAATTPAPPRMPEEYMRPTIVQIPALHPLEMECPFTSTTTIRRRRRRRFFGHTPVD
jgi:hypothetical protein